jgi:hypothetical protein
MAKTLYFFSFVLLFVTRRETAALNWTAWMDRNETPEKDFEWQCDGLDFMGLP